MDIDTFYLLCAVGGGVIMLSQFALTVMGLGTEGDADGDGHVDFDDGDHGEVHHHDGGSWLFHIITFRTVIAAITFFGLVGKICLSAEMPISQTLPLSLAAGFLAMLSVFWMMRSMHRFNYDGTVRLDQAIGRHATVYTSIPANQEGVGKIQVSIQDQIVELAAVTTAKQPLKPGMQVVVVSVQAGGAVQVAPLSETAEV